MEESEDEVSHFAHVQARSWNDGMVFVGVYHNIRYYTKDGKFYCCFGWKPESFSSLKKLQAAVRRWENEDE